MQKFQVSLPMSLPNEGQIDNFIQTALKNVNEFKATEIALIFPSKSFRNIGLPSLEYYKSAAERFKKVKEALALQGIRCVWYISLTIKSGRTAGTEPIIRADGSQAPFSACPLDETFTKMFSEVVAVFSSIAKPDCILFEDDFSVHASSAKGCFCPLHLKEFAKVCGKEYDRETLVSLLDGKDKKSLSLLKKWRAFSGSTLVTLAKRVRQRVDELSPNTPMGCMQTGADLKDGGNVIDIAKALADKNQKPIIRPHGTMYCGGKSQDVPPVMFNAMKIAQQNKGKVTMLHESDCYPHNLFYMGTKQMDIINSSAVSYGEDGLLFFGESPKIIIGVDSSERGYGLSYSKQSKRINTIYKMVKGCDLDGVELCHDWFYNSFMGNPLWCRPLGLFGIPTTSKKSNVAFWDRAQAENFSDKKVKEYLSKTLFLDGDSAKALYERGYGEYLGIKVGENLSKPPFTYDLGVVEKITPEFNGGGYDEMPCAHCYCCEQNGDMYEIIPNDVNCKTVASYYVKGEKFCDTMTYFENSLGGKVIVSGLTLYGNLSQAIYNYQRQSLIQRLIAMACDEYITCVDKPNLWLIVNKPKKAKIYKRLITVSNLGYDDFNTFSLRVPNSIGEVKGVQVLGMNGRWKNAKYTCDGEIISLELPIKALGIEYIKII